MRWAVIQRKPSDATPALLTCEIAGHKSITAATGTPIHLCRPRSSWQRDTNENANRLLRQYLPMNADLRCFTQNDLDVIALERLAALSLFGRWIDEADLVKADAPA